MAGRVVGSAVTKAVGAARHVAWYLGYRIDGPAGRCVDADELGP